MRSVWLNGEFVEAERACIGIGDRGFLYGDGLFETLRLAGGAPCLASEHLKRLAGSAAFFSLKLPRVDFVSLIGRLAELNGISAGAARITLTRGEAPGGPNPRVKGEPNVLITVRPLPDDLPARKEKGVGAATLFYPLRAEGLTLSAHKTLGYLPTVHALGEVEPGEEPLLETTGGHLSEGATANLFWVRRGILYTPSLITGCLPGVARSLLLKTAPMLDLEVAEGEFGRQTLLRAEEAFLINSVIGVLPVVSLNGREIGLGRPGRNTGRISSYMEENFLNNRNPRS